MEKETKNTIMGAPVAGVSSDTIRDANMRLGTKTKNTIIGAPVAGVSSDTIRDANMRLGTKTKNTIMGAPVAGVVNSTSPKVDVFGMRNKKKWWAEADGVAYTSAGAVVGSPKCTKKPAKEGKEAEAGQQMGA